jgi:hypothetical protein
MVMAVAKSTTTFPSRTDETKNVALNEAIRASRLRKGPPTDADRPRRRGRRPRVLPGQLDLEGREHDGRR